MLDSLNDLNEPDDEDFSDLDSAAFLEELEEEFATPKAVEAHGADEFDFDPDPVAEKLWLGMSAMQRFVLSALLFSSVCLLGFFFLLVTEKIFPPFLY